MDVGEQLVRRVRLREGIRRVVTQEGVDFSIHARDPVQAGLRDFARRNFARGEFGGQFGNG